MNDILMQWVLGGILIMWGLVGIIFLIHTEIEMHKEKLRVLRKKLFEDI